MANLSIKSKLLVMLLAVSLFSIAVVASLNYYTCYKSLQDAVFSHLTSVRATRADQIEQFIERLRTETRVIGGSAMSTDAARAFIDAYSKLEDVTVEPEMDAGLRQFYQQTFMPALGKAMDTEPEINTLIPETPAARYLQYHYIAKNPFPLGDMGSMLRADDASEYSRDPREATTRRCVGSCRTSASSTSTSIDIETGAIVYTESKEPDFATNLTDGPHAHSNLADLFRRCNERRNAVRRDRRLRGVSSHARSSRRHSSARRCSKAAARSPYWCCRCRPMRSTA